MTYVLGLKGLYLITNKELVGSFQSLSVAPILRSCPLDWDITLVLYYLSRHQYGPIWESFDRHFNLQGFVLTCICLLQEDELVTQAPASSPILKSGFFSTSFPEILSEIQNP